ncbi:hypothetical protein BKA62DRAFT_713823 [Auriculariales sp. MPI-PUGE-AT-0066]|nr:hypothetical protein BKA62DRAFT_713823 [Auriculariales sp. MPI-PUGE-AT-0066]
MSTISILLKAVVYCSLNRTLAAQDTLLYFANKDRHGHGTCKDDYKPLHPPVCYNPSPDWFLRWGTLKARPTTTLLTQHAFVVAVLSSTRGLLRICRIKVVISNRHTACRVEFGAFHEASVADNHKCTFLELRYIVHRPCRSAQVRTRLKIVIFRRRNATGRRGDVRLKGFVECAVGTLDMTDRIGVWRGIKAEIAIVVYLQAVVAMAGRASEAGNRRLHKGEKKDNSSGDRWFIVVWSIQGATC